MAVSRSSTPAKGHPNLLLPRSRFAREAPAETTSLVASARLFRAPVPADTGPCSFWSRLAAPPRSDPRFAAQHSSFFFQHFSFLFLSVLSEPPCAPQQFLSRFDAASGPVLWRPPSHATECANSARQRWLPTIIAAHTPYCSLIGGGPLALQPVQKIQRSISR